MDSGSWAGMAEEQGREGKAMEGPGRLRRNAATPASMPVVRHSGCSTSTTALRQPRASEMMRRRREKFSVWGSLDHQKCSATAEEWERGLEAAEGCACLSEGVGGGVGLGHDGP